MVFIAPFARAIESSKEIISQRNTIHRVIGRECGCFHLITYILFATVRPRNTILGLLMNHHFKVTDLVKQGYKFQL